VTRDKASKQKIEFLQHMLGAISYSFHKTWVALKRVIWLFTWMLQSQHPSPQAVWGQLPQSLPPNLPRAGSGGEEVFFFLFIFGHSGSGIQSA
jgi:hypothetical protein